MKVGEENASDNHIPSIHDVVLDEKGRVSEVIDRDTNTLFTNKENEGNGEGQENNDQRQQPAALAEGEEELEFTNFADLVVNKKMGNNVAFDPNMPLEEQAQIVNDSIDDIISHYEGEKNGLLQQIEELKKNNPGSANLTSVEIEIVNQLRSGKKLHEIAGLDTAAPVNLDDKEAVARYAIQKENPSWTPEEVTDEIDDLKGRNKLDKHYKTFREKVEAWQKEGSQNIQLKHDEELKKMQEQEQIEMQEDIKNVAAVITGVKDFYGTVVDQEMKDLAFRFSTEINTKTGNTYLMDLMATPEGVAEIALLKLFGQHIIDSIKKNSFNQGKQEQFNRFLEQPKVTGKDRVTTKMSYDLDKLSTVESIGTFNN